MDKTRQDKTRQDKTNKASVLLKVASCEPHFEWRHFQYSPGEKPPTFHAWMSKLPSGGCCSTVDLTGESNTDRKVTIQQGTAVKVSYNTSTENVIDILPAHRQHGGSNLALNRNWIENVDIEKGTKTDGRRAVTLD